MYRYFVFLFFLPFLGCGGTDLGDGVAIGGSSSDPIPQTEVPVLIATTPASPALTPLPTFNGQTQANAVVEIFSDSTCTTPVATGVADTNGDFSILISEAMEGGTEQSFWAQATAPDATVSECSSTSVSYRNTTIRPGLATLNGTQTRAPVSPTQVNQATAYPIDWSQSEFDSHYFSHSTTINSEILTIEQNGDYWMSATLPLLMTAGTYRPCVRLEIRVNGSLVTGGIGQSTYIRFDGATGNSESSGHVTTLVRGLAVGDQVEVYLQETAGEDGNEVVGISSVASLFVEYASNSRDIFHGTATRTVASTNINAASSAFEWTEDRKDTSFTHDDGGSPHEITLAAGVYLAYINVPISGTVTRGAPRMLVRLNGALVNGGQASQGYMRNDSGHNDASLHWFGYFSASNGDILTVTSEQEAGAGTINVQAGQAATLNLEKLGSNSGFIGLRASQLSAGVDWNIAGGSTIAWDTSDIHDTTTYTHSTLANPHQIQVDVPGDFVLTYNDSLSGSNDRVSPIIKVQVNGVDVAGAETKTHYIRNTSGHNESSAALTFLLRNLSAGDIITLSSQPDVGAGVVPVIEDALISILRK